MARSGQQESLDNLLALVLNNVNQRNANRNPSFEHFVKWDRVGDERSKEHTDGVFYLEENGVRTLIVYVDSPVWVAEFTMDKTAYLARVQVYYGTTWIDDLRFKVSSRVSEKKRHARAQEDAGPDIKDVTLTDEEMNEVEEAISVVSDGELKESMRRAMEACKKWDKVRKG